MNSKEQRLKVLRDELDAMEDHIERLSDSSYFQDFPEELFAAYRTFFEALLMRVEMLRDEITEVEFDCA